MSDSVNPNSHVSHSSFLIKRIPKLNDTNCVDWNLGLKTYLKGRRLWKHVSRDVQLSTEDAEEPEKIEALESERASVLEVIRATVSPTRLPVIRGIEDPKLANEKLLDQVSQDDGLEVAALIAQVATIRYTGNEPVSTFLDGISDLHTRLSEATAQNPDLRISNKFLAVLLLMSFPSESYVTIRDHLFGDLKSLTTSKVISRIKTKSALTVADEGVAMVASSLRPQNNTTSLKSARTDKSPNAPCVLCEHSRYTHTNGKCSRQNQSQGSTDRTKPSSSAITNEEKIRRYNQLASSGVFSFNTQTVAADQSKSTEVKQNPETTSEAYCQFATSYNTTAIDRDQSPDVMLSISKPFPPPQPYSGMKPTYADTACNKHMYGDSLLLEDIHDIDPIWIRVANKDQLSRICARQMGTAQIDGIGPDGTHVPIRIHNVLLSPDLPANLISLPALYNSGYRVVNPHYGQRGNDTNLYFSNNDHMFPAYRDESGDGFWKFYHYSKSRVYSSKCEPNSNIDCGTYDSVISTTEVPAMSFRTSWASARILHQPASHVHLGSRHKRATRVLCLVLMFPFAGSTVILLDHFQSDLV